MKYSFEDRLSIVLQVKDGKPISQLYRELGLHENKILEWVRRYDKYGAENLAKRTKIKATGDFKEQMVRLILEKGVTLASVIVDYGISRTAMESWVRKARNEGYASLHVQHRRGRPPKDMARPKKKEPQTELEKLQAENIRLKAENALLKKVKALAEEERLRVLLNGSRPSKS